MRVAVAGGGIGGLMLRLPLFDRPPRRRAGQGRLTLLGDAAHPMLPFFAQGAAQAIEDAWVLGRLCRARTGGAGTGKPDYGGSRSSGPPRAWIDATLTALQGAMACPWNARI